MVCYFNFFKKCNNFFYWFILLLIGIHFFSCSSPEVKNKLLSTKKVKNFDDTLMHQLLHADSCVFRLKETHGWESNPSPEQMYDYVSTLVTYYPTQPNLVDKNMFIYVNVISKEYLKQNGFSHSFDGYLAGERKLALSSGEIVEDTKAIVTMDSTVAFCRKYYNKKEPSYFHIAYIDYTGYIIIITFSTRSEKDLVENNSAFLDIVRSYKKVNMTVIDSTNSQDYISN